MSMIVPSGGGGGGSKFKSSRNLVITHTVNVTEDWTKSDINGSYEAHYYRQVYNTEVYRSENPIYFPQLSTVRVSQAEFAARTDLPNVFVIDANGPSRLFLRDNWGLFSIRGLLSGEPHTQWKAPAGSYFGYLSIRKPTVFIDGSVFECNDYFPSTTYYTSTSSSMTLSGSEARHYFNDSNVVDGGSSNSYPYSVWSNEHVVIKAGTQNFDSINYAALGNNYTGPYIDFCKQIVIYMPCLMYINRSQCNSLFTTSWDYRLDTMNIQLCGTIMEYE